MKNNYEQLLNRRAFDQIISLTKNDVSLSGLMARLISLSETGFDEDALLLIDQYFDVLKQDVKRLFPLHSQLLRRRQDKLAGFRYLALYETLPYASIEVEEGMKEFRLWLQEVDAPKKFNSAAWRELVNSGASDKILKGLARLPLTMVPTHIAALMPLLRKPHSSIVRFQTLTLLVGAKVEDTFIYDGGDFSMEVNPSLLDLPLKSVEATTFVESLKKTNADPSTIELALNLLEQYAIAIYPQEPPFEDSDHLLAALFMLVQRYLGVKQPSLSPIAGLIGEEIEHGLLQFKNS